MKRVNNGALEIQCTTTAQTKVEANCGGTQAVCQVDFRTYSDRSLGSIPTWVSLWVGSIGPHPIPEDSASNIYLGFYLNLG